VETHVEVERLRRVYQKYAALGWGQTKWSTANQGNQALRSERQHSVFNLLKNAGLIPLGKRRILDVGCGVGEELAGLLDWGAAPEQLFGVDLIPERIEAARQNYPGVSFQTSNAESIPFPNASFELILVYTVFSSILDPHMARNVAAEIHRVLTSKGVVVWYDFRMNNPFNRQVRGLARKQIQRLFPAFRLTLKTVTLLPPLARRLGRFTRLLYGPLSLFPFLRTHYLGLLAKP
jgi:ubiquinone/menaquinone biosynthesis C-methylase UbiE